jgi:hypothetical protein
MPVAGVWYTTAKFHGYRSSIVHALLQFSALLLLNSSLHLQRLHNECWRRQIQFWKRNIARFNPGIEIIQTGLAAALLRQPAEQGRCGPGRDDSQAHYIKIPHAGLPTRTRLLHRMMKQTLLSFPSQISLQTLLKRFVLHIYKFIS